MTEALVPLNQSSSIALSTGIKLTDTGANIDADVSREVWAEALRQCQSLANASVWALGDLLVYAHDHPEWGETYSQFLELTGKSYSTLTKATYLSKQYLPEERVSGVSWSHHMAAASVEDPHERRDLLHRARDEGWTREQIRDYRADTSTPIKRTKRQCPQCGHQW